MAKKKPASKSKRPTAQVDEQRRLKFIQEYVKTFNATKSAIAAGYSAKTAKQQGSRLLTRVDVQNELSKQFKKNRKRLKKDHDLTIKDLQRRLARIITANISDYMDWNEEDATMIPKVEIDNPEGIQSIKVTHNQYGSSLQIKLKDDLKAMELLGNSIGMFNRESKDEDDDRTNQEALDNRLLELLEKHKR